MASGSATIRAQARTTCTRSTVRCPGPTPSSPCTKTWLPVIDPDSGRFTYVTDKEDGSSKTANVDNVLQILKVVEIEKADDIRRPYIKQLLTKNLKFPLPHRVPKAANRKIFSATRPSTFY